MVVFFGFLDFDNCYKNHIFALDKFRTDYDKTFI